MSVTSSSPKRSNSVQPRSRADWRRWLERNHASSDGVWLVTFKKSTGKPRVEYADAVEEALCFGWVDSKPGTVDAERSRLWFSPRNPKSGWSRINKERIARLEGAGLMTAAGREVVAAAKKNGAWSSLDAVESLEIPGDLRRSLAKNSAARRNFEAFPPSSKKIILTWISSAKRQETRAMRIEETVRLAARNIRANHWRQPEAK